VLTSAQPISSIGCAFLIFEGQRGRPASRPSFYPVCALKEAWFDAPHTVGSGLNQSPANGIPDQAGGFMDVKFLHESRAVGFSGFRTDS
jgi:hypothetical protein